MAKRKNDELKRCPFCGGEAHIRGYAWTYVECEKCYARTVAFDSIEKDAIEAWNRRINDERNRNKCKDV